MKTIKITELAEKFDGEIVGDNTLVISGMNSLGDAKKGDISFLANKKYKKQVASSAACAVIVGRDYKEQVADGQTLIHCDDPNIAFSQVVKFFAPPAIVYKPGVHKRAVVEDNVTIGKNVHIGANVVIEEGSKIGDNTAICAGSYIGHNVIIGENSLIYQNVTIRERSIIGNRVIIHSGTVVGSDGFGFSASPTGIVKIEQAGFVQLDDDVEIGANTTIDRARFGKTWLKQGVKVDNLVQIAHNVVIGEYSMIIAMVGISGSTELGQGVIIAGQAGVSGHLKIGAGAKVGGGSAIVKDVPEKAVMMGYPAEDIKAFIGRNALPKKIERLKKQVKNLEDKLL